MKNIILAIILLLFSSGEALFAQKSNKKETKKDTKPVLILTNFSDTISYMIGTDIARSLKQNNLQVNQEILFQGIRDGMNGKDTLFTKEQFNTYMQRLQKELRKKMEEEQAKEAERNKAIGKKWLEDNKKKPGVMETASGLQYKVIKEGQGPKPGPNSTVKVHYEGRLIDGKIFDSSYDRGEPLELSLSNVIKGWTEGLQLMPVGSIYELYIPSELGYGDRSLPNIPAGSVLIFKVELLDIVNP
jgi:FKBP-type peptidyl-prolyl cis-trans isomerase FklB